MIQFNLRNKNYLLIEIPSDAYDATVGVTRLTITSKKEAVVQAINQFLKFYNENNNNRQSR